MTSIRRPSSNTGITGGIKGVKNNKTPASPKKTDTKKHDVGGWKPNNKPTPTPTKPPGAR